jgi:hypothetical protein
MTAFSFRTTKRNSVQANMPSGQDRAVEIQLQREQLRKCGARMNCAAFLVEPSVSSGAENGNHVEPEVRKLLSKELGVPLAPEHLDLGDGTHVVRIPAHADQRFQSKPITDSGACRSRFRGTDRVDRYHFEPAAWVTECPTAWVTGGKEGAAHAMEGDLSGG